MPTLKVKLEFEVEIERVNESEDYGLSDYEVKDYFPDIDDHLFR